MRIKEIKYEKLVNDGNFSHRKLAMTCELSETDDPRKCYNKLKNVVDHALEKGDFTEDDIPF